MLLVSPSTYIAAVALPVVMGFVFTGILEGYSQAPQDASPGIGLLPVLLAAGLLHGAAPDHEVPGRGAPARDDRDAPHHPGHDDRGRPRQIRRRPTSSTLAFWGSTGGFFYILKRFAGDPHLIDPGPHRRGLSLRRGLRAALHRHRRLRELALPQPVRRRHPLPHLSVGIIFGGLLPGPPPGSTARRSPP